MSLDTLPKCPSNWATDGHAERRFESEAQEDYEARFADPTLPLADPWVPLDNDPAKRWCWDGRMWVWEDPAVFWMTPIKYRDLDGTIVQTK